MLSRKRGQFNTYRVKPLRFRHSLVAEAPHRLRWDLLTMLRLKIIVYSRKGTFVSSYIIIYVARRKEGAG